MLTDKVSIIIVTFNAKKTIRSAIRSVTEQQYSNAELIIVDGASTDGTVEILKELDHEITCWKSERDNGIYDAMNKGIEMATGKWLLFLGADDKLCKGILNHIFLSPENSDAELIYGLINTNDSGKLFGGESNFQKMVATNIPHQAIFYAKTLLSKFNGYDTRYKILADYDLNLKIFEQAVVEKKFINTAIAIFCSTGTSNRTIDYLFFTEKLAWFIDHHGLSKTDKRLAKYYFFIGVAMVLKKNYSKGFRNLVHPIIYGGRRLYYFLLVGHFLLTLAGVGRKYKYV